MPVVKDKAPEEFVNSFTERFKTKKLLEIYDDEIKNIIKNMPDEDENGHDVDKQKELKKIIDKLLSNSDPREKYFKKRFPQTVQYIQDNVFHAADGLYYVLSYNKDRGFYPKEYDKTKITDMFISKFPPVIKKFFTIYNTIVNISIDHAKPRFYTEGDDEYLNLFNGYPFDAVKRSENIINKHKKNVTLFWSHIKENLTSSNEQIYDEVHNWITAMIGGKRKMKTALYFKGNKGTGKSILLFLLSAIVGEQNAINIQKANDILGNFNGHLAGKLLVSLDDTPLTFDQFCQLYAHLKTPITEKYNTYRDLFQKSIRLLNINSYIICSNHPMLKLEVNTGDERRYVQADVFPTLREKEYYATLWSLVEDKEFQYAFYWYCQDNYNPEYNEQKSVKTLPITNTAQDATQNSLTPTIEFIKYCVNEDTIFNEPVKPKKVYDLYKSWYTSNEKEKCRMKKYHAFCSELDTSFKEFIEFKTVRLNCEEKTNWLFFDKPKYYQEFQRKGFFSKYEDASQNVIEDPLVYYGNKVKELKEELAKVEQRYIEELTKKNEEIQEQRLIEALHKPYNKRINFSESNKIKPIVKKEKLKRSTIQKQSELQLSIPTLKNVAINNMCDILADNTLLLDTAEEVASDTAGLAESSRTEPVELCCDDKPEKTQKFKNSFTGCGHPVGFNIDFES